MTSRAWWPIGRAIVIGAVLVAVLTAPTLTHLTTTGRLDTNDGRFSIWNVAWIDHALLTNPTNLLNANIFWPHRGTLAYSELNLVAGVLGLPWYAATGRALAALNGAVATALVLAFVCMWALVRRLSGSDAAGLAAATAFTFCPYVSARTPEVQLLMIFAFPLVMLSFHRLAEAPGPVRGVELGLSMAVAALASGYYGVFAACALGATALVFGWPLRNRPKYWGALIVAAIVSAVVVGPVFLKFMQARAASGASLAPRNLDIGMWSANLASYFASNAIGHIWWLDTLTRWQRAHAADDPLLHDVLFPGLGVLTLAAVACAAPSVRRTSRRTIVAYTVVAVLACWASFGPAAGLYHLLDGVLPGMSLLRAPARFGIVVTFALAVLAGLGVARLEQRWRWAPWILVVALACELGVYTPAWGWPSWPLVEEGPVPAVYRKLAHVPPGPLVEFPFPYVPSNYHNHAHAMYWSTYHWLPLVNGYSDLVPPDFDKLAEPINYFPSPDAFAIMRKLGVRYVLWHAEYIAPGTSHDVLVARLAQYPDALRPVLVNDDVWLYEIVKWPS